MVQHDFFNLTQARILDTFYDTALNGYNRNSIQYMNKSTIFNFIYHHHIAYAMTVSVT